MIILGIETSTMTGSVALLREETLLAEFTLNTPKTHTERLLSAIDCVLQSASIPIHEIDGIAVASGPGSFTGLRIGVTTAKSLAYSIHKPVVGVSSLDALASQILHSERLICPILDARKKEVYTALYRNEDDSVQRLSEYAVIAPDILLADMTEPVLFLGDGVTTYRTKIETLLGEQALFADAAHRFPRASLVAQRGGKRLMAGEADDAFALTPFYLRKSDAEIHWERQYR